MNDSTLFLQNLRYWTPHVLMSASASFAFARMGDFKSGQAVAGMLGGIIVFIFFYALLWSSERFRGRVPAGSDWERAFLCGTWIRSAMGVLGTAGVLLMPHLKESSALAPLAVVFVVFCVSDLVAGFMLGLFISWAADSPTVRAIRVAVAGPDAHARGHSMVVGDVNSLLPTFFITICQGIILSLMLWVFSVIALWAIRAKARRKTRRDAALPTVVALT